jgi:hypothetical protein
MGCLKINQPLFIEGTVSPTLVVFPAGSTAAAVSFA